MLKILKDPADFYIFWSNHIGSYVDSKHSASYPFS